MKNCDTILAKHVIAITKQDLINLVVANEAVDMKVDNLIPNRSRCYMETYLPSKYLPTTTKFSDFVLFQVENRADEEHIDYIFINQLWKK